MNAFTLINKVRDICPICEDERDLEYRLQSGIIDIRGERIETSARVFYCASGDHSFSSFEDEEEKVLAAYNEYRRRKGLLQPEEIREIRRRYGMSQKNFAKLLGFGAITVHRYETGVIQDDAHNTILLSVRDANGFKELFERKKHKFDSRIVDKIMKRLNELKGSQMCLPFEAAYREYRLELMEAVTPGFTVPSHVMRPKYSKIICTCEGRQSKEEELALAA